MYFVETGNATEAAVKAGYSASRAKQMGWVNMNHPRVREEVDRLMEDAKKKSIATADEVLQYLTRVIRNEETEDCVVVADGVALNITKEVTPKDKIKAAELLAKRYGILTENVTLNKPPVVIVDDI